MARYSDARYDIITKALKENPRAGLKEFRAILSAVHVEGLSATLYSNIYDLRHGTMYLYHYRDYQQVAKVNLAEELKSGERSVPMNSLFKITPFAATSTDTNRTIFSALYQYCDSTCQTALAEVMKNVVP